MGWRLPPAREIGRWVLEERARERAELRAATGNLASRRVAERAGYRAEGVLRNAGITRGGRVDLAVYSLPLAELHALRG